MPESPSTSGTPSQKHWSCGNSWSSPSKTWSSSSKAWSVSETHGNLQKKNKSKFSNEVRHINEKVMVSLIT